jgi:sulfonate transport system substrate-binding protein
MVGRQSEAALTVDPNTTLAVADQSEFVRHLLEASGGTEA